jgi:hypothetical protein
VVEGTGVPARVRDVAGPFGTHAGAAEGSGTRRIGTSITGRQEGTSFRSDSRAEHIGRILHHLFLVFLENSN